MARFVLTVGFVFRAVLDAEVAGGASEGALYTAGEMRGKSVEVTVGRVIVVMGTAQVVIGIVVIGTVEMGPY